MTLVLRRHRDFIDDLQNIVTIFSINGFSVGIGDLVADSDTNEQIKNVIVKTKKQVSKLNQQVHQKIFENIISDTLEEEFEKKVNNLLNKAISDW